MRVYFDSSAIVCLYIAEPNSQPVIDFVASLRLPILLNRLQDLEKKMKFRESFTRGNAQDRTRLNATPWRSDRTEIQLFKLAI